MTQYQSALTTLIGEVLADPDLAHSDVFRRMLQAGLQDLVDAESTAKIGAARYERTSERTTRRNGTRPKVLATPKVFRNRLKLIATSHKMRLVATRVPRITRNRRGVVSVAAA